MDCNSDVLVSTTDVVTWFYVPLCAYVVYECAIWTCDMPFTCVHLVLKVVYSSAAYKCMPFGKSTCVSDRVSRENGRSRVI